MRQFTLNRKVDASGVSGTGIVAEGVVLTNGKVVLSWLTKHTSTAFYDDIATLEAIHGHGGSTEIVWGGEAPKLAPVDPATAAICLKCGGKSPIRSTECTGCGSNDIHEGLDDKTLGIIRLIRWRDAWDIDHHGEELFFRMHNYFSVTSRGIVPDEHVESLADYRDLPEGEGYKLIKKWCK